MYRVRLMPRAESELEKIPEKDSEKVAGALQALADNPKPYGVTKLRGRIHRVRVGNWRIVYAVFDKDKTVIVGKIVRRSEDTYDDVGGLF